MLSYSNEKNLFLELVIDMAELKGWSNNILEQACLDLNLDPKYYHVWFPGGINDILTHLEAKYDTEMLAILENSPQLSGITNKIAFAVKTRICDTSRSKLLAQQNSYHYMLPYNSICALRSSWRTVDLIWQYAGDASVDFNYYSKRGLLSPIYIAGQAYYNLDESENHTSTQKFIETSLNQVVNGAKYCKQIPEILHKVPILRIFL
jgi:ubiquinone biosynthesis protein COQ9